MTEPLMNRSLSSSLAYLTLCDRLNQAGAVPTALPQILWRIGAHPGLIAHDRVLRNLAEALNSEVFTAEALHWAGPWRADVDAWIDTLRLIEEHGPQLRAEPVLREFFKQPRTDRDHPLLGHGVGRHPIAAALFNTHQSHDADSRGRNAPAAMRFDLVRSHVVAVYAEARSRAAMGLDHFLVYAGDKEFAPVPMGASPVGLVLRELSLEEYAPLLMQLPMAASTTEFAYRVVTLQADFSVLPLLLRERAARYLTDLQHYLAALPALLIATKLEARTRNVEDPAGGPGGSTHRPGWIAWTSGEIKRLKEADWDENAPVITQISLPADDEPDPLDEEADGDMPGSTRDSAIELYDPLEAAKVMSRMRFRRLQLELRSQELMWSLDIASRWERAQALLVAQASIDLYLKGTPANKSNARLAAVGAVAVKACALFGWTAETTAAISILRVDRADASLVESHCYVQHDHICLLVQQTQPSRDDWTVVSFLLADVSPKYQTKLSGATEAVGRLRQRAFLLPDVGGLGQEILAIAASTGRLPLSAPQTRRALGVESNTAARLARDCLSSAADPINEDPTAALTMGRLAASVRASATAVSGDAVAAWMITQDHGRCSEARLHYTQVRAAGLPRLHEAALRSLDADRWKATDADKDHPALAQTGWVGCRHVVDMDRLRQVLRALQARLMQPIDLSSRSEIRAYHNDFALHAWLVQSLCLALRAGHNRPGVWRDVELRQGAQKSPGLACTGMADKHNGLQDKSRLLPLFHEVVMAANHLEQHNAAVIQRLDMTLEWRCLDATAQRHFVINDLEKLAPVRPSWIKDRLAELGLPVPVNFGRALLRTEWLDSGCPGTCVDGFIGHFDGGQNLFAKHSAHDPQAYLQRVTAQLTGYVQTLRLVPLPSLCVPAADRSLSPGGPTMTLPSVGLRQIPGRRVTRPIWWNTNITPVLPQEQAQLWAKVGQHAARSDRHWLTQLLWVLKNWGSPHAQALLQSVDAVDGKLDEASAGQLEDEVLMTVSRHQLPWTVAASWLRMLLAAQMRLRQEGVDLVSTRVAALTTNPESPVSPAATLRLPLLAQWEAALHRWIELRADHDQPEEDPRYWAIAIGLSAINHGMVLDMRLLSCIMEWLARPGSRRLQLCAGTDGFAFLEFELPSSLPGSRQCVRWFPDPITELLILRAPSFPVTPELGLTSRYVGPFLRHHGVAAHHCCNGWRAVMKVARALWSTRVPQHVVQCAQRSISTTSLTAGTWARLFGTSFMETERSGALLTQSLPAPSEMLTLEDLTFDPDEPDKVIRPHADRDHPNANQWLPAGRDIDHVRLDLRAANPWLADVDEALKQDSKEVPGRLAFLRRTCRAGSFAEGALRWLESTAVTMLNGEAVSEVDPMIGLRRVASTLLPRLASEMGDTWFGDIQPQQRNQVLGALTHELETGASIPDLRRGVALLQGSNQSMPTGADAPQAPHPPSPPIDIENPDSDVRVDARMLTIDEYETSLAVIRTGIQPPLRPAERIVLEDLLHLGVWTLARPREYLEARLGDFQIGEDGSLDMLIREYAAHGLKTKQATRRVPLSLLAPVDVCQRIKDDITARLGGDLTPGNPARRQLFFAAPEGQQARTHHDRLLGLLRQVLRRVTGDPDIRVYSLRHAGANWLLMALEADGGALWERLWSSQPAMLRFVQDGDALRLRLLGSTDRSDRRAMLAITKLQGHLAAATTFMHYLHLTALLQLQAVYKYAEYIPKNVLAAAACVRPSTFSEQSGGGFHTALQLARTRAGWTGAQPSRGVSSGRTESAEASRWLGFGELQIALDAYGRHGQSLANIGAHFRHSEAFIRTVMEASAGISQWVGASVTVNENDSLGMTGLPNMRMNEAERLHLEHLIRNMEMVWRRDPRLAVDAVGLIMDRTTQPHEEVTLQDPLQLETALSFFHQCGIVARDLQFVLRRRNGNAALPAWAAESLGPYTSVTFRVLPPDTRSSDDSLEKWLRIRLVDRKGQALSQVLRRATFAAWVNMSAALVNGGRDDAIELSVNGDITTSWPASSRRR